MDDTLEQRREKATRELYARLKAAQEDKRVLRGVVAQATGGGRLRGYRSWRDSVLDEQNNFKNSMETAAFDLAPIRKRTPTERLDSMIRRLKDSPEWLWEAQIRAIEGEFWKLGTPVTGDALRAAAAKLLNQAEKEKKR